MKNYKGILIIIVLAQFCCTSLWFAGNGVMNELIQSYELRDSALGHLTSAVQLGFILGTLIFAALSIADRYSPSRIFLISAILGAVFNLLILWSGNGLLSLIGFRFLTGFFLAGIYPVGMKIASDYYQKGLGLALGFLVGALVLGTGLPHLLKALSMDYSWQSVIYFTTGIATMGGIVIGIGVPDGPYRVAGSGFNPYQVFQIFKNKGLRAASFGYFGHMWELYAFWAFVPVILNSYQKIYPHSSFSIPLISFIIIAAGGPACVIGGILSKWWGAKPVAFGALLLSLICCIVSPLVFGLESSLLFIMFLVFWGGVVVADSPLFSTLVAENSSPENRGTALTIVNSIGFAITIVSIQLLTSLNEIYNSTAIFTILALGPIFGLIAMTNKTR